MKRAKILILLLVLSLSLAACGEKKGKEMPKKPGMEDDKNKGGKGKDQGDKQGEKDKDQGEKGKDKGQKEKPADKDNGQKEAPKDLSEILKSIQKGVDLPASQDLKLDKSNFEDYSFAKWDNTYKAVASESEIMTNAHSLVLVKTEKGKAEKLAKDIAEKADVRKWICVEAELGKVLYNDEYVLLMMTYKKSYDGLKSNFEKAIKSTDLKEIQVKSAQTKK